MVFRRFFHTAEKTTLAIAHPVVVEPTVVACPVQDTAQTRRSARDDLLTGIGVATEANLSLGAILRDAFGLVSDMAAFSTDFESTADLTRTQVERSVASVEELQRQSDNIEMRLRSTSLAVTQAHTQSKAALGSVGDLTKSIDEIERVIRMIATIASQTNLLALNATIEAARAGSAGAGFGIVANEVKALSQATQRAANEIVASVNSIRERAEVNRTNVAGFDETVRSIEHLFDEMNASVRAQTEQTHDIGDGSGELVRLAHSVRAKAGQMRNLGVTAKKMTDLADGAVTQARRAFAALIDRAGVVLAHSEVDADEMTRAWPVMLPGRLRSDGHSYDVRVIDISPNAVQIETGHNILQDRLGASVEIEIAGIGAFALRLLAATPSGYYTTLVNPAPSILERIDKKIDALRQQYEPYIVRVREVAKEVGVLMDRALDAGTMSESDLFDTVYRRDGPNEPPQYMNAAVLPLEKILRTTIEEQLTRSPQPDFCFVQDRNGFAAIHNLRFSHLSRPDDVLYNLRHARTRRIFDDRVGMSAARNLRPYLVQSYARDMGDRVDLRMEFDAPIFARGRHWGSVRMAYELADATSAPQIAAPLRRTTEGQPVRDNLAEIA